MVIPSRIAYGITVLRRKINAVSEGGKVVKANKQKARTASTSSLIETWVG
jgi:hypothetical protein